MSIYAIVESGLVTNIVVSDSVEPLRIFFPDSSLIEATDATGYPHLMGDVVEGRFRQAKPFDSWVWDEYSWSWSAPVPYPQDESVYVWDETAVEWVEVHIEPEPAPGPEA